jgi:hypothetical protein
VKISRKGKYDDIQETFPYFKISESLNYNFALSFFFIYPNIRYCIEINLFLRFLNLNYNKYTFEDKNFIL